MLLHAASQQSTLFLYVILCLSHCVYNTKIYEINSAFDHQGNATKNTESRGEKQQPVKMFRSMQSEDQNKAIILFFLFVSKVFLNRRFKISYTS